MAATTKGYIGIDNGTQGLSIIFTNESLEVLATGEGSYEMVPNLGEGCYEQRVEDWESAMSQAMKQVKDQVTNLEVLSIGLSGQMHGEVLMDEHGKVLGPVRLWCDARNEDEGNELTKLFISKVPKRMTSARFLWTIRNRREIAKQCRHMTTPAGWMSYRLTGMFSLGIGDASGMFPVSQDTMDYREDLLEKFDSLIQKDATDISPLKSILPRVCIAGQPAGYLNAVGAKLLGLPEGIPVAPAEGDQPAALAGSLIGRAGTVSCSFGTSVFANSVGDRQFKGVSSAVDHFCAADGKPINMVWLRNGTTFMNTIVSSYGDVLKADKCGSNRDPFSFIMPELVDAPANCGGLLALPFMNDEAGVNVSRGGSAMIIGWYEHNAQPGNVAKAALMSTCFNLKRGSEVLDEQGYPRLELVLTGGLAKTPECAQILSDIFDTPTILLDNSHEGSAFGASLLAKFLHLKLSGKNKEGKDDWAFFLDSVHESGLKKKFVPISQNVKASNDMYERYKKLLDLVPALTDIMTT